MFFPYVDKKAHRRLRARAMFLKRIPKNLKGLQHKQKFNPSYLYIILEHDLDLVDTEIQFLSPLIDETLQ